MPVPAAVPTPMPVLVPMPNLMTISKMLVPMPMSTPTPTPSGVVLAGDISNEKKKDEHAATCTDAQGGETRGFTVIGVILWLVH